MRLGVICEGPSDLPAIKAFVGHELEQRGVSAEFDVLFPEMDCTRPEGGWANVLLWLKKRPARTRVQTYFSGGLFGGDLSRKPLDGIIIHLDSDIIEDPSFRSYVYTNYGLAVACSSEPQARADTIRNVLEIASDLSDLTEVDRKRHVLAPAVEATEAWCVAAFETISSDCENLRGVALTHAFMSVLERSEGRAVESSYSNIDKSPRRREIFCVKHRAGSERIYKHCPQFAKFIDNVALLA